MTKEEVLSELRGHIAMVHRTQSAAAAHWGVSAVWVGKVLSGRKNASPHMLRDIGVELTKPEPTYRRIKKVKS